MQTVSSMNTSVNTSKLPAIWKKLNLEYLGKQKYPTPIEIVDYGSGRNATVNQVELYLHCNSITGVVYWPYDPYWGDINRNRNAISCLTQWKTADLCVCANVLNVIDDVDTIRKIIQEVAQAKHWIFQIYEGDKTGKGCYTKPNCWQHNKKTCEYLWIFNELGVGAYYVKGNFITNNLNLLK